MSSQQPVDIIKEAILLERRGEAFYRQVAEQAREQSVKEFFNMMAAEEARHADVLGEQLKFYMGHQKFGELDAKESAEGSRADRILTDNLKQQIAAAGFEAAAISAAMLMEERAVAFYGQRADATDDPNEKALFHWLTQWEQGHLSFLARLDKEIKETIWNDQQFWPF